MDIHIREIFGSYVIAEPFVTALVDDVKIHFRPRRCGAICAVSESIAVAIATALWCSMPVCCTSRLYPSRRKHKAEPVLHAMHHIVYLRGHIVFCPGQVIIQQPSSRVRGFLSPEVFMKVNVFSDIGIMQ